MVPPGPNIENDGDYDAFICSNTDHRFYINDGAVISRHKLSLTVLGETLSGGRGSAFADYDNDGFVDLLVYSNLPQAAWYLFRNNGNGTFTKAINQTFRIGKVFLAVARLPTGLQ
ncbi:MAG: VCBS repeat-containing protein [Cytophagales bacterium]|nr:VCBS repeat-containing protein [Cytophagales bacterium]